MTTAFAINAKAALLLMDPPDDMSEDFRDLLVHVCRQVSEIADAHRVIVALIDGMGYGGNIVLRTVHALQDSGDHDAAKLLEMLAE